MKWRVTWRKLGEERENDSRGIHARTLSHGMFRLVHGVNVFGKTTTMAKSIKIPPKINANMIKHLSRSAGVVMRRADSNTLWAYLQDGKVFCERSYAADVHRAQRLRPENKRIFLTKPSLLVHTPMHNITTAFISTRSNIMHNRPRMCLHQLSIPSSSKAVGVVWFRCARDSGKCPGLLRVIQYYFSMARYNQVNDYD